MKKIIIVILIVAIVIAGGVGIFIATGHDVTFFDDYVQNFSDNLLSLRLKYEQNKAEKQDITQETTEPVQTATPSPVTEIEQNEDELTKTFKISTDPVAVSGAANARYARFMNGILVVSENSVDMYTAGGKKKWSKGIQLSNPVLKCSGAYFMLFEKGGNKLIVFNDSNQAYLVETTKKILNGNISSSGDSVLVTEKAYYKGAVSVYNKSGEEVFSRSFGSENVVSAAISNNRELAVALLSVRTQAYSKVVFFDINKTNEKSSTEFDNTIIYDLDFSTGNLIAYADDKIISLKSNGREDWVYSFEEKNLIRYVKDSGNVRLLLFDNNNNAELSVVTSSGKQRQCIKTDVIPDFCDISDGFVIYNSARNLRLSKLNGDAVAEYTASRDIKKAYFIDSDNILIVYNSSLEFLKLVKDNTNATVQN